MISFGLSSYGQRVKSSENQLIIEDSKSNQIAVSGSQTTLKNDITGSFQLIISNPDMQFAINEEFVSWVEENRIENKDVTLKIDENISIFILSKEKITSANFQPVSTVIYSSKP